MVTDPKVVLYKIECPPTIGGVFFIGETVCENYRNKRNTELQFLIHMKCFTCVQGLLQALRMPPATKHRQHAYLCTVSD